MRALEQKKLLTLIASSELQRLILETLSRRGIGGYTVVPATGAGASGIQSGMLFSDSNVVIYIILSEPRLLSVLEDIDDMMQRGYRIKAIIQDITLLPRKPESR
jgi:PII-like signaling protein